MEMTNEDRETLMRLLGEGYGVIVGIYLGKWDVTMFRNPSAALLNKEEFRCHQSGLGGSLKSILEDFEKAFVGRGIRPGY
jgi:hypothetical protein